MKGKLWYVTALIFLGVSLIAGCARGLKEDEQNQTKIIKVLYSDEDYFYRQYGDLFTMKEGNVEFEVVSTQGLSNNPGGKTYDEAFDELVEREKPDILMLNSTIYEKYVAAGKLLELDPLIQRDGYSLDGILSGLVEALREIGDDKLYGLNPTFYGSVLYYNKDLFEEYGVEPPHDGMTWEEIMELAQRFPGQSGENGGGQDVDYGYAADYPLTFDNLVILFSSAAGLNYFNPDTMEITIDTDSWKKVYELALNVYKSDSIYSPEDPGASMRTVKEAVQSDLFMTGRAAMTVNSSMTLQQLNEAPSLTKDYKSFEYGIVAAPVDPAAPDYTREISLGEIVAINAETANPEAAWEFWKFVNGAEFARINSKTLYGLMSRTDYSKEYKGTALDAFYALKPKLNRSYVNQDKIPQDFAARFQEIRGREIGLVLDGTKPLEEALKAIQQDGQALLTE
ncbi:extracellular solute-binding protein [Paenibacillus sp. M1]|uniref:Extracellular solute-binding protein n=1 Tax=Paenibacillus haidiansis TaxID=1574488 RepID=A0ABU7VWM6_9BACL